MHRALVSLIALVALGCGGATAPPPSPARLAEVPSLSESVEPAAESITILGTADLHGHMERLPLLAGYIEAVRASGPTVLVDAGDMWQGTLASNLGEGAAVVAAYGALRYDAATIGNHEFDYGPVGPSATCIADGDEPRGALLARTAEAEFAVLAANIRGADGAPIAWPNVQPSVMFERSGIQIGVLGLTTADTLGTTIASNVAGLEIEPLADATQREAQTLRDAGAQVVVVTAHAGGECTEFTDATDLSSCDNESEIFELARALPVGLVDVIVAGHTHKAIAHEVNGVAIISSWALGRAFGRVDLRLDHGRVVERHLHPPTDLCETPPCEYGGGTVRESEAIREVVAPALAAAAERLAEPLGPTLDEPFLRSYSSESSAGNLLTDALSALRPDADGALLNAGGVRASFPAGPLTYGALYEVFPFDNLFATVRIRADQLASVIASNAGSSGGTLILGKLRARVQCGRQGMNVRILDSRGRPIPNGRVLTITTSDYLATTSVFSSLPGVEVNVETNGPLMREGIANWFRAQESASLSPTQYLDEDSPRISIPGPRPFRCAR
ncbi:MAG: 2',3'-cyclic-nucleotide 2'-phosphodiesterase (5'-nucleotidase family) [Polyangiales bacterium]|jgi:2',3'-cyclic-nucleotide 2'-phosphodiesterase (5'-nucleotidase family)